ncbi:DUF4339 domain-containing protein [Sphingobacterium alkalisoli]|uniref:DUF4339 domain-containing protein n=1 Tax=Sphingobacterium alkalisoli TaxID=1874115 RepID=A0A4U0GZD3_9SPHI|nr:CD225/dispanin family protein [Sphingobacterium alkalisoli]TJY64563.1 DUF4339 domain-containing protein [Sphingobacterium alkalisoli]GGH20961.1 hypothetical protein GCM10011418_26530 [Sphingobacterium alkalisoli]
MKKYHYSAGNNSYGPFTLEELRVKDIGPDTLVWTEELVTWTRAGEVPELRSILADYVPPPPSIPRPDNFQSANTPYTSSQLSTPNYQRPPKTYLVETVLTTIFCCWPLGIPAIIYASRVEKKFYAGDIIGAEADSANAKKWMLINIGASVLLWIGYFGIFGLAIFAGLSDGF